MATPQAQCTAQEWSFNSLGQSPCYVAAELGGACRGSTGSFQIPPLPPNKAYLGPEQNSQTACRCSTVFYSMLSACGHCQQRPFLKWSAFQTNCTNAYLQTFPQDIPQDIIVPKWAYLPVQDNDVFDPEAARQTKGEVKPGHQGPLRNTNIGAIIGGTLGGVAFLVFTAIAAYFFFKRRREGKSKLKAQTVNPLVAETTNWSTGPTPILNTGPMTSTALSPLNLTGQAAATGPSSFPAQHQLQTIVPMRPYNPNDPSTYPAALDPYPIVGQQPGYPSPGSPSLAGTSPESPTGSSLSNFTTTPLLPSYTGLSNSRTTYPSDRKDYEF